jgi:hypothetical protein
MKSPALRGFFLPAALAAERVIEIKIFEILWPYGHS